MSGHLSHKTAAFTVVRCSGISDDGSCGREQTIESHDGGTGVRVASKVSAERADWLASFGWCRASNGWLCPFCAGNAGQLAETFGRKASS